VVAADARTAVEQLEEPARGRCLLRFWHGQIPA
jgi:hypothetical protein